MFNSYLAAIKFMESSEEFGEEDIAKIGLLVEENAKRSRVEDTRVVDIKVIIKLFKVDVNRHDDHVSRRNVKIQ